MRAASRRTSRSTHSGVASPGASYVACASAKSMPCRHSSRERSSRSIKQAAKVQQSCTAQ
eukprot:1992680-Alexandrium_andersonii.AAC.1